MKLAKWVYWDGWKGNHDMRLEANCSNCGQEVKIRGYGEDNLKYLPKRCSCGARMLNGGKLQGKVTIRIE